MDSHHLAANGGHSHDHDSRDRHSHSGHFQAHSHDHAHPHVHGPNGTVTTSRRDFLHALVGGAMAGASILEMGWYRAAWARATAPGSNSNLFDLQKVADGVYFAHAHPQALINCNAAIFVRSKDVVVVDAHSKPSAAASLIAQIKREVTPKPVRYVINSHFHWDHTQGNHGYRGNGANVDFIATAATKQLMSELAMARLKESIDGVPPQIDALRERATHSNSAAEKAFCAEQIGQMQAYLAELKDYTLELPTITFDKTYLLRDPALELHLEFHGHAHTAGDVFVFCPQQRVVATGDASHCFLPFIRDGFPHVWPGTIDSVCRGDFKYSLPGHGPFQRDRTVMISQRNYIEELTGKVDDGKKAGLTVAEMQKRFTVASLKSLQSNGYEAFLIKTNAESNPHFGAMPPLQDAVNVNIGEIYATLDKV
jgi:glyoxylase-like metal-dependent hydrolase (beta-lactamase superfamily II)